MQAIELREVPVPRTLECRCAKSRAAEQFMDEVSTLNHLSHHLRLRSPTSLIISLNSHPGVGLKVFDQKDPKGMF